MKAKLIKKFPPRNTKAHKRLMLKAADVAESVLPFFEKKYPRDKRPRKAIEAARAWARGKITLGMTDVRKLALAAHAAARKAKENSAARFTARAAGHAIATWHVPSHARGAKYYATKAIKADKIK
jgi:hypothetical protein